MAHTEKESERVFSFEKLDIWHHAVDLTDCILDLTNSFSDTDNFGLISQIEIAVSNVAQHIAQGKGRQHKKEFVQCLYMAEGALFETLTLTEILKRRGLVKEQKETDIRAQAELLNRKLHGLINFLKGKQQ